MLYEFGFSCANRIIVMMNRIQEWFAMFMLLMQLMRPGLAGRTRLARSGRAGSGPSVNSALLILSNY